MFKKRLCADPHADGQHTSGVRQCPDIWELNNGDVAVIGIRKTAALKPLLPESAGCGPDEEIVVLPKSLFETAIRN